MNMSIAKRIMRVLPNGICSVDGVFSVDSILRADSKGTLHLGIELDDGQTLLLSLTDATEENSNDQ